MDVIVAIGEALVNSRRRLGDHPCDAHGIADDCNELARSVDGFRQGKRRQSIHCPSVFRTQYRQVRTLRHRTRDKTHRGRGTGKKDHKIFNGALSSFIHQFLGLGVAIPGLGDVAVGGNQSIANKKAGARDPSTNAGTTVGKSDLIHAVDVADRVAIAVEHNRRHRLLLPELLDLCREFVNPLLQVVLRYPLGSHPPVVVNHGQCTDQHHDGEHTLDHLLPAITDNIGFLRSFRSRCRVGKIGLIVVLGHVLGESLERLSSPRWRVIATVPKGMYMGYVDPGRIRAGLRAVACKDGGLSQQNSSLRDSGRTNASAPTLRLAYSQDFRHFLVQESLPGAVGLHPSAVNHELGNGSLASTADDFFGGAGRGFNVDFFEWNIVLGQEAFRGAAVGTPEGRVERDLHFRRFNHRGHGGSQGEIAYTFSNSRWVRSLTTFPVFRVEAGSNNRNQHSSSATGLCSTPRGTTMNSPSSTHSCGRSRNSMRKRPLTTRKSSSSCS